MITASRMEPMLPARRHDLEEVTLTNLILEADETHALPEYRT
jgi:hypothetical protein